MAMQPGLGTLGFSSASTFGTPGQLLGGLDFTGSKGAVPSYTPASGVASGPAYGTGFTTNSAYAGTPTSMVTMTPISVDGRLNISTGPSAFSAS